MNHSVLAKEITMYRRVDKLYKYRYVNLLNILQSDRYKPLAEQCSKLEGKEERQYFKKKNVPIITPSGIFGVGRKAEELIQHTGLICIDLDGVEDIRYLKDGISDLPFVAYCGKSISGFGLFAIIPIPGSTPEEHKRRYAALEFLFIKTFGIEGAVDAQPKSVAASRYVSYDPVPYYNHSACIYYEIGPGVSQPAQNSTPHPQYNYKDNSRCNSSGSDLEKISAMIEIIERRRLDFAPTYDEYLRVAFSLANLGEPGRNLFHGAIQFNPKYNGALADKQFDNALMNVRQISLGTFFGMCNDYGLMQKKDTWSVFVPAPLKIPIKKKPTKPDIQPDDITKNELRQQAKDYLGGTSALKSSTIRFQGQKESPSRIQTKAPPNHISKGIEAFVNDLNELFIQNPMDANRFTVYPNIDSYNRRTGLMGSRYKDTVDMSKLTPVFIHLTELKVLIDQD